MPRLERYADEGAWLEARCRGIGASDIGGVLGLSPWESPLSVWAHKTGAVPPVRETAAMRRGKRLEPMIAEDFAEATGLAVIDHGRFSIAWHDTITYLYSSLDRELRHEAWGPGPLEIKSVGESQGRHWPPAVTSGLEYVVGRAEVPRHYYAQIQQQMLVTGAAWGAFAVWVGFEPRHWRVLPDPEFQAAIVAAAADFWRRVEQRDPPAAERADDYPIVRAMIGTGIADEVISLDGRFIEIDEAYQEAEELAPHWENRKKALAAKLLQAIGTAKAAVLPNGTRYTRAIIKQPARVMPATTYPRLFRRGGSGE